MSAKRAKYMAYKNNQALAAVCGGEREEWRRR